MTLHTIPRPLDWAWEQERIWSETADRLKHRLNRARTTALILALTAAVLAVAAAQLIGPPTWTGRVLSAGAGIAAGIATLAQRQAGTEQIRTWTRARSASEGLKTEIYSYLASGSAYTDPAEKERVLGGRTRALVGNVADLQRHTTGITTDGKALPAVTGAQDYITHRVNQQIDSFYRPKAALYEHRVRTLRTLGTALGAATVVLTVLAASFDLPPIAAWVPVATTAATSVTAHIAAARYDHMIIEYLRTAQHLEHLREDYLTTPGQEATFIDECENAISTENQGWMAAWNTDENSTTGAGNEDLPKDDGSPTTGDEPPSSPIPQP
jgi:hypothetical protein